MVKGQNNGKSTDQFKGVQIVVLDDQGEEKGIYSRRLANILVDLQRKGIRDLHDVFDGRWKPEEGKLLVREEDLRRVNSNTASLLNMAPGQKSERVEMAISTLIAQYRAGMQTPVAKESE